MTIEYKDSKRIVTSGSEYKVHKFTSTGNTNFVVTGSGDIEYLVVAGGGGHNTNTNYGGGGAGGLRTNVSGATTGGGGSAESTYGVTAQTYTITVGLGGAITSGVLSKGGNSSIVPASGTSIISTGGGAGNVSSPSYNDGGSGGGGDYNKSYGGSATSPTQGYAGGAGGASESSPYVGGGGGGAGTVGVTASRSGSGTAGNGGDGLANSITGASVTYAAGGGGRNGSSGTAGAGGSGGIGGAGTSSGSGGGGGNGNVNTGSGGGGGGGSGGTGIVIIRYLTSSGITATGGTITTITETQSKPTDVPDNSILIEKDNAKRFWFESELAPTYETDFSSSTGWNNAGSVFDVNTTTEQLEASVERPYSGAIVPYIYYDLISGTVSDTAWVCNFKLVVDTTSYSTVRGTTYIILSSVTGATSGSVESGDHMGMALYINAGAGNFYATHVNGGALTTNTISSSIVSGETTYYVSFIRNGDNFQFDLYSDIDRTALVNSVNGTTSGIADLRYLRVQSETDGGSTYTGDVDFTIDDLKFYNGVTSVTPATWTYELPKRSSLKLHLDASDASTITKDGSDLVSQWNDKSGNSNNVVQATATNKPTWTDSQLNGLPAIVFNGSDNSMNKVTWAEGEISQPYYVFAVMTLGTNTASSYRWDGGTSGSDRFYFYQGSNNVALGKASAGTEMNVTDTMDGNFRYITFLVSGSSSNYRKDGSSHTSGDMGTNGWNGITFASRYSNEAYNNPKICEFLVYDSDIGTATRDKVESYLKDKWGL